MNNSLNEHAFMAQAIRLAKKGLFTTRINPRVGCLIVKGSEIIGQGFHAYPEQAHAEINALNNVQGSAEDATVYVTLEPCMHQGKTPPCVDALAKAKIKKVVMAMLDPNPKVNGKGNALLQSHGIETLTDVMSAEAARLNKGFIQRFTMHRPYITVKSAMSLDGRTAMSSGESKWISAEAARKDVQKLRARSCAMLTGVETVLLDDPSLNVRLNRQEWGLKAEFVQPKRIILDTHLRTPPDAKILNPASEAIIYTCSNNVPKRTQFEAQGVEIVRSKQDKEYVDLRFVMQDLAAHGFNEVLVEAGSTLVGQLLENKLADEMIIYMAPHLMGSAARALAKLPSIGSMQERMQIMIQDVRHIGQDIRLCIKPQYV